jgi:ABC-type phosphate transport system substrate-binding protein
MIDQDRAARAVEFLIDSAAEYGAAKADAIRAETMLRVVKALAMKSSDEKSASAQEREAYASEAYLQAVDDLFEATKACETLRAQRDAAQATIEWWRSANANQRVAERGYASAR